MKTITSNFKQIEDTIIFENEDLQKELATLLSISKSYRETNANNDNISDEEFEREYKRLSTEGYELKKDVSKSEYSKERGCIVNYGIATLKIY